MKRFARNFLNVFKKPATEEEICAAYQAILHRDATPNDDIAALLSAKYNLSEILLILLDSDEYKIYRNSNSVVTSKDEEQMSFMLRGAALPESESLRIKAGEYMRDRLLLELYNAGNPHGNERATTVEDASLAYRFLLGRDITQEEHDYFSSASITLGTMLKNIWESEGFGDIVKLGLNTPVTKEDIVSGFDALLGRFPNEIEASYSVEHAKTLGFILQELWQSDEFKNAEKSVAPVTDEDVTNAYTTLLGRFPEVETLSHNTSLKATPAALLNRLWQSDEFKNIKKSAIPVTAVDVTIVHKALLGSYPEVATIKRHEDRKSTPASLFQELWFSDECSSYLKQAQSKNSYVYGIGKEFEAYGNRYSLVFNRTMTDTISRAVERGEFIWAAEKKYIDLLPANGYFLDIGANIGAVSMMLCAKGWHGFAVEASKKNVDCLQRSIILNGYSIKVGEFAISNQTGDLQFVENGPWGSIENQLLVEDMESSQRAFEDVQSVSVPAFKLDDWRQISGLDDITSVDFIKMDIEGSEIFALCGMHAFLENFGFPAIFSEVNGYNLFTFGNTPKHLFKKYAEIGYSPYILSKGKLYEHNISHFQLDVDENYLFIHESDTRYNEYKTTDELAVDETMLVDEVVNGLLTGWHLLKIHTLYSLQDYPELANHDRIAPILKELKQTETNKVLAAALAWH